MKEEIIKLAEKYFTTSDIVEALFQEFGCLEKTEKELIKLFGLET